MELTITLARLLVKSEISPNSSEFGVKSEKYTALRCLFIQNRHNSGTISFAIATQNPYQLCILSLEKGTRPGLPASGNQTGNGIDDSAALPL